MRIVFESADGPASALFVVKITRTWFVGRILMPSFVGS
uniref:Uncharacterized protein n=1 Tax=Setaria viridis TaxID=4556 RepID=A0A4V6Y806_SETVI|nr:hypothetical protein SEVIR_7G021105v2 [Setaria viridis]